MVELVKVGDFRRILPRICQRDTSSDPKGWTPENPFWGHSAAVALVAWDLFHSGLFRMSLKGTEFAALCFHYRNLLADDRLEDFTGAQFQGRFPAELEMEPRARESLFLDRQTLTRHGILKPSNLAERYDSLKERMKAELQREREEQV